MTFPFSPSAWSGSGTASNPADTSEQADEVSSQPETSEQPDVPAKKI